MQISGQANYFSLINKDYFAKKPKPTLSKYN